MTINGYMKRTVSGILLLVFPVLLLLTPLKAWADDKEYSIDKAAFEVWLNEDGSAVVEETWTVRFIKGSFSRFYKGIYTGSALEEEEKFSGPEIEQVTINDHVCEETNDAYRRPDYCYHVTDKGTEAEISMYLSSRNRTNTYVMRYRLNEVVKCVDNEYWLFVYRFIGANFEKKVDHVYVRLHAPDGAVTKVLYASKGQKSASFGGSEVSLECGSSSGMYRVRLRMDGSGLFPGAVQMSSAHLSNRILTYEERNMRIAYGILAVIAAAMIWPVWTIIRTQIWRRRYRKNPEIAEQAITEVLTTDWMNGETDGYRKAVGGAGAVGPSDPICYYFAAGALLAAAGDIEPAKSGVIYVTKDPGHVGSYVSEIIRAKLEQIGEECGSPSRVKVTTKQISTMMGETDLEKLYTYTQDLEKYLNENGKGADGICPADSC